jgi:hypothetical protein
MPEANINDRATIERLYPREDFERDAAANADAKATVHRGLKIVSAVDGDGRFSAERGSRHVGESDPEGDTVFVSPFLEDVAPLRGTDAYGGPTEATAAPMGSGQRDKNYRVFIDRIIETARAADFKPDVGRHEDRLRGFHGG